MSRNRTSARPKTAKSGKIGVRLAVLVAVLTLAIALYSGYWVYASGQTRTWVETWIAEQERAGYAIDHDGVRVGGYPFRIQAELVRPDVTAPRAEGGWSLQAERLSATAMSYNVFHWILSLEGPLRLDLPGAGVYRAQAERAQLDFAFSDGRTQRLGVTLQDVAVETLTGAPAPVERLERLGFTATTQSDDTLHARLEIVGLSLEEAVLDRQLAAALGPRTDLVRLDATATRWSVLADEADLVAWSRAAGALEIGHVQVLWGALQVAGDGALSVDAETRPEGRLSLTFGEAGELMRTLGQSGLIEGELSEQLAVAVDMAPQQNGGVSMPLRIQDGQIYWVMARIGRVGPLT